MQQFIDNIEKLNNLYGRDANHRYKMNIPEEERNASDAVRMFWLKVSNDAFGHWENPLHLNDLEFRTVSKAGNVSIYT